MKTNHERALPCAILTFLTGAAALPAAAEPLEFFPQIAVSGIYTDNIELEPEPLASDELAFEVRPSFELRSETDRFFGDLEYQLQHFQFREESDRDSTYHNASLQTRTDIVEERLQFELNGGYGQAIVDPRAPIPDSNVLNTGNLTDYASLDARPSFVQRLGGRTRLQADYAYGIVRYPDFEFAIGNNIDSFDRQQASVSIGTDPSEPGFQWLLEGRKQTADYEDFGRFRTDVATAELGLPLGGRQLYFVARGGSESDVQSDPRSGGLDETFWEGGMRWSVAQRQRLELRVGERFFGRTYFADLAVQRARANLNVSYRETPTTASLEQLNSRRNLLIGGVIPQYDVVGLTNDVYVSRELNADVQLTGARTELSLEGRRVKREYVLDLDDDRETGGTVRLLWRLGPRTQIAADAYFAEIRFRSTTVEDELRQYTLGLSRQIGRRSMVSLQLRASDRDSTALQQTNLYEENAVTLTWAMGFGRTEVTIDGFRDPASLRR